MNRKRARHLFLELSRRIYFDANGTLKGFGKTAAFYNDDWRPNHKITGGYKKAWNSDIMQQLRQSVGM